MKKKFLITLLTIFMCLMIVGCGKENNLDNSNNKPNSNHTNENIDNNSNNTLDNTLIDDDEIIDFDDEDNVPIDDGYITVEEVINCNNCVFSYFSEAKHLGGTIDSSEYTNDINNLKTSGGKQRHNFFGFVLSGNKISKAYSCILKENKIYCIEGSTNGAYHSNNIAILNKIFTSGQCRTISSGHTYTCTDGSYNGDTQTSGYTSLHYETSCTIYGSDARTGELICH